MNQGEDFAFETTLSTKSYQQTVLKAQQQGYSVTLLFFWLDSVTLAKQRVAFRVSEGGHNIPEDVIERRYDRGLYNLFELYIPICDNVMLFDNSNKKPICVMEVEKNRLTTIYNEKLLLKIKNSYNG